MASTWSRVLSSVGVSSAVVGLAAVTVLAAPGAQAGVVHPAGLTVAPAPTFTVIPPGPPLAHGVLYAWGDNTDYALGDGTTQDRSRPEAIPGMHDVIAVAGGDTGSIALKADGSVWAWGKEYEGELGDGHLHGTAKVPQQVPGLSGIVAIGSGVEARYAVTASGAVYAWGSDFYNELGNGTYNSRATPKRIAGLPAIRSVAGGEAFAMALAVDGSVWGWGDDLYGGQLDGSGPAAPGPVPVRMDYPTPVTGMGAGEDGYAITGGHVEATGFDGDDALGDNGASSDLFGAYEPVYGVTTAVQVVGGSGLGFVRTSSGRVRGWGTNEQGQLGNPDTLLYTPVPVTISGLTDASDIAVGDETVYAVQAGQIYGWGGNEAGQVGDGTTHRRTTPTVVSTLSGVTAVFAAHESGFAIWN